MPRTEEFYEGRRPDTRHHQPGLQGGPPVPPAYGWDQDVFPKR